MVEEEGMPSTGKNILDKEAQCQKVILDGILYPTKGKGLMICIHQELESPGVTQW